MPILEFQNVIMGEALGRAMEKHRDSPRWKRLNLVRWVLGITLFHLPWQEALNSLIL